MATSCSVTVLPVVLSAVCISTLAAADDGYYSVFKSQDRGHTWSQSHSGLPHNSRINAFAASDNAILAGTDTGIYISRDQGSNWAASASAGAAARILSFAALGATIYAGTDRNGIIVSQDAGLTWTVKPAPRLGKVRALLAHAGELYAGTDSQGVFVTRDGANSWTPMSDGLPGNSQIFSLAALKGQVFAALYGKGLYVWAATGPLWRKVGSVSPLALAAAGDTLLAGHNPGGILRSDDLGARWSVAELPVSDDLGKAPVWELAAGPEVALAGISSGVYRSEDRGRHWTRTKTGLPNGSSGIAFLLDRRFVLVAVYTRTNKGTARLRQSAVSAHTGH